MNTRAPSRVFVCPGPPGADWLGLRFVLLAPTRPFRAGLIDRQKVPFKTPMSVLAREQSLAPFLAIGLPFWAGEQHQAGTTQCDPGPFSASNRTRKASAVPGFNAALRPSFHATHTRAGAMAWRPWSVMR